MASNPAAPRHAAPAALARAAGIAFLLLVAALPWSIAPMSIGVVLTGALTLAAWWARGGERWVRTPADVPALIWVGALAVTALAGTNPAGGVESVTRGLLLALIPVAAFHARDERAGRRALAILFASAAVATVYALARFIDAGGAFPARARGAVGHPLTYGGQLLLLASLATAVALRAGERRWRLGALGLLALLLPAFLGTCTRSAWLGYLVAAGLTVARIRLRWLAALGLAAAVAVVTLPAPCRERAVQVASPGSRWNVERVVMWEAGLKMFRDRPMLGHGPQDLHALFGRYVPPGVTVPHGHLHSVPIHVAATMGIVGLAALAWLVAGLFRTAIRFPLRAPPSGLGSAVSLGVTSAVAGFFVAGLFEWNLGDEELLDMLYTLVGLAFAAARWGARDEPRARGG